jgi:hypothetical protein
VEIPHRVHGAPSLPTTEERTAMARILAAINRALRFDEQPESAVHFHAAGATPEVCYDARCGRPHLDA